MIFFHIWVVKKKGVFRDVCKVIEVKMAKTVGSNLLLEE